MRSIPRIKNYTACTRWFDTSAISWFSFETFKNRKSCNDKELEKTRSFVLQRYFRYKLCVNDVNCHFQGGVYLFQLMDFYSCSGLSLLWVCFFQTIAIGWFFGADRFCCCVEQMTGHKPGLFWYLCWKYFAPAVMFVSEIFQL